MKREELINSLIRHEGLRLVPYQCTAGKLTIGVGRNLDDNGISKAEALIMLANDVARCEKEMAQFPWFKRLAPARQDALLNMVFNLGIKGFKGFKRLIYALEKGYYEVAAAEMLDSEWADQVGYRARELSAIMRAGSYLAPYP